ncbi:MAG: TonB family protein [Betaproteobacteria bacterium]|nr:TonB family protein [Betaproteobacteria bacterium]MBI2959509.1 TonB family protein [Betaproteobacteria bacterium]
MTARRALVLALLAAPFLPLGAQAQEGDERAAALELYRYRLLRAGTRLRGYPQEALALRLEGQTGVLLHINGQGALARSTVTRSSGHRILDEHALALLAAAVPLTEIPTALQNTDFAVRVVVAFALPKDN